MEVKRSTLLRQNPKLAEDKAFFSRANKVVESREKDKASKCYQQKVVVGDIAGRPLFPPKPSGYNQKPCPTKASVNTEELVKHMSNVPGYLQRAEKADNVQEKALNFGVLDWRRLEKWTGDHRYVVVDEKTAVSPARSNASSSFSMFGSSSQSCGSSGSSYIAHRTKVLSSDHCQGCEEDYKQISQEEASLNSMEHNNPQITHRRCPIRHRIPFSAEQCLNTDNLVAKLESTKQTDPGFDDLSDDLSPSPGANHLPPRSKDCATSNSANRQMNLLGDASNRKEKRSGELGYECASSSVYEDDDYPEKQFSHPDDGVCDHFQKSVHNSRHFSFESTESGCAVPTESGHQGTLQAFRCEDSQYATFSPNVSVARSRPFPYDSQGDWSDVNKCKGLEVPCPSTKTSPHSAAVATVRSNDCLEKHSKSVNSPHNNSAAKMCEKWDCKELKPDNPRGRESLPNNHFSVGSSGVIRSSSLRESSATRQLKYTPLERRSGDKVADSGRGRRSPLRRLLDPLLKPKTLCEAHPARVAAGSSIQSSCECNLSVQELASTNGLHSSYNANTISSTDHACDKGSNSPCWVPLENNGPANDEKNELSTKQALLRLAWKNGLPLLTFSMNESDILAATRKKATSIKQDSDYIYTFHYVHEIKKKSGGWIIQGNKGKRKELISRVVGQMNVSRLKCIGGDIGVREFALFGPELRPTSHEPLEPVQASELAAIVVRIPKENLESSVSVMAREENCQDQVKARQMKDEYACQTVKRLENEEGLLKNDPTIAAILPRDVHGLSDGGKPSPLVERWKSGGLCDCGGWDVGCSLSILTNKLQDGGHGGVQSCDTTDGSHRVELFNQGEEQESRPVFSLVSFKQELYTVHFHASIAPLQAFSLCVALLHSRKHTDLDESQDSPQCAPTEAPPVNDAARKQVGPSSMSVPYHPPLSPVGRA